MSGDRSQSDPPSENSAIATITSSSRSSKQSFWAKLKGVFRKGNKSSLEENSDTTSSTAPGSDVVSLEIQHKLIKEATYLCSIRHGPSEARRVLWRAVMRANYFLLDPDTEEPTVLYPPLKYPDDADKATESYIFWRAKQEEHVGRSVPTAEHMDNVRRELRDFLSRALAAEAVEEFPHLAFLL
ncbi:hypothetical protein B0A55_00047 [Friedmanniomyces simplex]|uniref:Uncharacterized protein n=1 Tax=Friedmanniomyces simplex TaxID=329884 RepID=A0A4V5NIW3_9PEZI|nr:hypothetical protein B0A55_00047 [Friedmanniomyces simplex]